MAIAPEISVERVQELIDAFEIVQPNWNGREGRTRSRVQLCAAIVVSPVSDQGHDKAFAVLMHDLSDSGLGFLHVTELHPGDRFVIAKHPSFPVSKVFNVIYCVPHEDGRFHIGGKFV